MPVIVDIKLGLGPIEGNPLGGGGDVNQWRREEAQMRWIEPYFPLSNAVPKVDDRRVISGIIFVICNDLCWRDAPKKYGSHKTISNHFIRWSRLGVQAWRPRATRPTDW